MSFSNRFTTAIFDMDGTLTDTMYIWENLSRNYLLKFGITPPENLSETLGTISIRRAAKFLQEEFKLPKTQEQIYKELVGVLNTYYSQPHPLRPGTLKLLQELKRRGATTAVLSATVLEPVKISLRTAGIEGFFDYVFSTEDMSCGKSRPQAFTEIIEKIGATPEKTIVFEDAVYAITSAKEAGCAVCAVPGFSNYDPRREELADIYLSDFSEFPVGWFSCRTN